MIVLTFAVSNPYFKGWRDFKNIRNWAGKLPLKNKYWEFEVMRSGSIVEFDFTMRTRCDHAGVTLGLGLFNYSANFTVYDNRHWDHELDRYLINGDH
jgi:hypothetical protein